MSLASLHHSICIDQTCAKKKQILKIEERKGIKQDHSLSLDQDSKEIVKQINLVLPYLSRKFQE